MGRLANAELTLRAGDHEPGHPRAGLCNGHFRARQHAAGRIGYGARQMGDRDGLTEGCWRGHDRCEER